MSFSYIIPMMVVLAYALGTTISTATLSTTTTAPHITAWPTETLFLGLGMHGSSFVGQIIQADRCATTAVFGCPPLGTTFAKAQTEVCDYSTVYQATWSSNMYIRSQVYGKLDDHNTVVGNATTIQTCILHGTTKADCKTTYALAPYHSGKPTTTSGALTLTGSEVRFGHVAFSNGAKYGHVVKTDGQYRLKGLAACTSTSSKRATTATDTSSAKADPVTSTSSGGSEKSTSSSSGAAVGARATGVVKQIVRVLVLPGAAAALLGGVIS